MSGAAYIYLQVKLATCLFPDLPIVVLDLVDEFEYDLRTDAALEKEIDITLSDSDSEGEQESSPSPNVAELDLLSLTNDVKRRNLRAMPGIVFSQFKQSMLEFVDNWTTSCHPAEYTAFLWDLHFKIFADDWAAEADATMKKSARFKVKGGHGTQSASSAPRREQGFMVGEEATQIFSIDEVDGLTFEARQGILDMQIQEANEKSAKIAAMARAKIGLDAEAAAKGSSRRSKAHGEKMTMMVPEGTEVLRTKLMTLTTQSTLDTALQEVWGASYSRTGLPNVKYAR